ncbi:MAG: arginine repressor [Acidimicrobiia bacterium]
MSGVKGLSKTQRQHRIARLLESNTVSSQEQLVELLADDGVAITRATISRDLEELGVIKVRVGGASAAYAIPHRAVDPAPPQDHLRRVLSDWVVEIQSSLNLVVLTTPPGSAHVVASALDRSSLAGLIGTVAGDDTVLCVASEELGGPGLFDVLYDLAGLNTP